MRTIKFTGLATVALVLAACSADRLVVPEYNNPTPEGAAADPLVALNLAAGGIITLDRAQHGGQILANGIFGRETFNYTPTEPRNTTGYLVNPEDPTSFGSGNFNGRFQTIRAVNAFLTIAENATILTETQKQAARGFARTFEGLQFLHYIGSRHDLGGPVVVPEDPTDIQPFVTRDSVYSLLVTRLNDAKTALQAGGATFPFSLSAGFAGFNTPTTFVQFNRAIAARALAYRGSLATGAARTAFYQQALTALGETFVSTTAPLDRAVSHVYSTAAGDVVNTLNTVTTVNVVAHPSIVADAQQRPAGAGPDARLSKTRTIALRTTPGGNGISTTVGWNRYPDQAGPIPIIRNEELILLRAEARWFTNDQPGALADLNHVRTTAGQLAALTAADIDTEDEFITRLLYERRYSLVHEGHRWIDVRRFGRLTTLPLDIPSHVRALQQVIPQAECLARQRTGNAALFGPGCPT
jgi:starch-binding outer membrane protein, SusD/RagB family